MKTHLEFVSTSFSPGANESTLINPGLYGKKLADFLAAELAKRGYHVISICAEDWGWMVELKCEQFPLWIGCGNYEELKNGFLCFIEPSQPYVRKWFSKIETASVVEPLAIAIEKILLASGKVEHLRWWREEEL